MSPKPDDDATITGMHPKPGGLLWQSRQGKDPHGLWAKTRQQNLEVLAAVLQGMDGQSPSERASIDRGRGKHSFFLGRNTPRPVYRFRVELAITGGAGEHTPCLEIDVFEDVPHEMQARHQCRIWAGYATWIHEPDAVVESFMAELHRVRTRPETKSGHPTLVLLGPNGRPLTDTLKDRLDTMVSTQQTEPTTKGAPHHGKTN